MHWLHSTSHREFAPATRTKRRFEYVIFSLFLVGKIFRVDPNSCQIRNASPILSLSCCWSRKIMLHTCHVHTYNTQFTFKSARYLSSSYSPFPIYLICTLDLYQPNLITPDLKKQSPSELKNALDLELLSRERCKAKKHVKLQKKMPYFAVSSVALN